MQHRELPIGFSMALAMNEPAMAAYVAMSELEKEEFLKKVQQVKNKQEMHQMVNRLVP